jgi:hypothetical protein
MFYALIDEDMRFYYPSLPAQISQVLRLQSVLENIFLGQGVSVVITLIGVTMASTTMIAKPVYAATSQLLDNAHAHTYRYTHG